MDEVDIICLLEATLPSFDLTFLLRHDSDHVAITSAYI